MLVFDFAALVEGTLRAWSQDPQIMQMHHLIVLAAPFWVIAALGLGVLLLTRALRAQAPA